jgi:hypothetical protein
VRDGVLPGFDLDALVARHTARARELQREI